MIAVAGAVAPGPATVLLDGRTLRTQTKFDGAGLARDDAVLAAMNGAPLVHVVAHALFNSELPMESLIFVDAGAGRGSINALDIMKMDFTATRLVVLSACGTARGRVVVAAEIFGFLRGLMAGGARTMVLNHWAVDDAATAGFFGNFYEALKEATVAEALRRAATAVARNHRHPFFWGAPTLYGWWR